MSNGRKSDDLRPTDHGASGGGVGWPDPPPPRRLPPVSHEDASDEVAGLLDTLRFGSQPVGNIFATLAHHPKLLKRWTDFGGTLLFGGELPGRDRELLILRTGWTCRAHYEWAHHVRIARAVGISDEEIARSKAGPSADGWDERDQLLLAAADELHESYRISDATWAGLSALYNPAQLVEICMVVGQYHLVAYTLNSLGVQLEDEYVSPEIGGD